MPTDIQSILKEFEPIELIYSDMSQGVEGRWGIAAFYDFETTCLSFIERNGGSIGSYTRQAEEAKKLYSERDGRGQIPMRLVALFGVAKALKNDIAAGYMRTFQERVHADMFADFLEAAQYFLTDGFKDPAAVMIGGVLEEHLKQLCRKNKVDTEITDAQNPTKLKPKKAETLNTELRNAGVYGLTEQKQITAWLDLRNNAAHAHYDQYDKKQVEAFLTGVLDLTAKYPA